MIALSLIAIVYIGLVALKQSDMKKLVAYSSISHMGFVTLGFFHIQCLRYGRRADADAFARLRRRRVVPVYRVLYDRVHSREIAAYGGVANKMPVFAAFFMLFRDGHSGLPGTSAFVGEFMVIMGAVKVNFWYAFAAASTLIFGAAYTLWMYKRVIFGAVCEPSRRRAYRYHRAREADLCDTRGIRVGHGCLSFAIR